jgi:hypothetical protein
MTDTMTTMTIAQVAGELLHHARPESDAARVKVGRLVKRGMPCIPFTRPRLFMREQVVEWLKAQAEAEAERNIPAPVKTAQRRRRRRAESGTLAARVAALREQVSA